MPSKHTHIMWSSLDFYDYKKYFNLQNKSHRDYKNQQYIFNMGAKVLKLIGLERSIKR